MKKILLFSLGALVAGVFTCTALLPERYAVNAPFWGGIFGADPLPRSALQLRIQLPDGFEIDVFAEGIRNARFLRFTSIGDLLVTSPGEGAVLLIERDADGDGRADGVQPLLSGLDRPHGIDLWNGWLYVAETGAVKRVLFDAESRSTTGPIEEVVSDLPAGQQHFTRTLRFGPDDRMYVSVGSSCNVCIEDDPRRAAMLRYRPDGSELEIYATGLRNSVGFDWRPGTDELFATDNGRDLLGDDFPPCELNRIDRGGFYGWPFANGARVPDPDLGAGRQDRIESSIPPFHGFAAHTAPLGMTFYRGDAFPPRYDGAAFVALHGSWNRTKKIGYKVVALEWGRDGMIRESDFATGFELDENVIGRPVDVAQGPDGALYVSDDFAGAIYRISHERY